MNEAMLNLNSDGIRKENDMKRRSLCLMIMMVLLCASAIAQKPIVIDEADRVKLPAKTAPSGSPALDLGQAKSSRRIARMRLVLPPWFQLLQDAAGAWPGHHPLRPTDPNSIRQPFPPSEGGQDQRLVAVTNWLRSKGLLIEPLQRHAGITFSGTVAQVEQAFKVEIHNYTLDGRKYYANVGSPSIPRALSQFVLTVKGLDDLPGEKQAASGAGYSETTLHSFTGTAYDLGAISGPDNSGNFYGTTGGGGSLGLGTVFRVNAAGNQTTLYNFAGSFSGDGATPVGQLVTDGSGNLYGTTEEGGANGYGTVFELVNSSGNYSENVLYSFTNSGTDGANPQAGLYIDSSGNLYGTTSYGGADGCGTVFELVKSSGGYSESVLYSFTGMNNGDGADPEAGLVMDGSGDLFGTTYYGGANGYGTVFELVNSSGSYTENVLYSFTGIDGDGADPEAGLVMDGSGDLFGTTYYGGADGYGTVFEFYFNSPGNYTYLVLHSFALGADGAYPQAGLIIDASNNLYGTSAEGGTAGYGTVFELAFSPGFTRPGAVGSYSEKVLYSFSSGTDGVYPEAGLTIDASGTLYGTTLLGGSLAGGAVFELTGAQERVFYSFPVSNGDGAYPYAGLTMGASGALYGTTASGGAPTSSFCPYYYYGYGYGYGAGCGTVFEVGPSSSQTIYSFGSINDLGDGAYPYGGLTMDASGNLYGTTSEGGDEGYGTVFELVNSSGTYSEKVLYSFTGGNGDGASPFAGLVMDASGNLYGTTEDGGDEGYGTVFELVNSSGNYSEKVLYSFGATGVVESVSGLVVDTSGNLYGTTSSGGANGYGTVFELVNSSGNYIENVLYSFTDLNGDGAYPEAGLVIDGSGNLYGTTVEGGTYDNGTVFELFNSSGTYTESVLYSFTDLNGDGAYPEAGLVIDGSGNLYGTTAGGGTYGNGTVFELFNSSGTYTESVLYSFNYLNGDGAFPYAGLIIDGLGNLYGTTDGGGSADVGTAFKLAPPVSVTVSSNTLSFSGQTVGTTSAEQSVTVTNSGTSALNISGITISGSNASAFSQTNNCVTSIGVGASCAIDVTFAPAAAGEQTASLSISDNAPGSPQTVSLSGTGVLPLTITTTSLPNGELGTPYSQSLQASGGSGAYNWTVSNGSLPSGLSLTGATISGTPVVGGTFDFTVTVTDANATSVSAPLSITEVSLPNAPVCPEPTVAVSTTNPLLVTATTECTAAAGATITSTSINWGYPGSQPTSGSSGTYQYPPPGGSYSVTVTATDSNGLIGTATANVTVTATAGSVRAGQPWQGTSGVTAPAGVPSVKVTYACTSASGPNGTQPISQYGLKCTITSTQNNGATVILSSTPTQVTVTVSTTAGNSAQLRGWRRAEGLYAVWLWLPGMMMIGVGCSKQQRKVRRYAGAVLLAILLAGFLACGGGSTSSTQILTNSNSGTSDGAYSVTVTGTSSGGVNSSTITVGFNVGG